MESKEIKPNTEDINSQKKSALQVYVRVRPRLKAEFLKQTAAFCSSDGKSIKIINGERSFEGYYDSVFGPDSGQKDIYAAVDDLVKVVKGGINATVFAYGQTGSGKTHTMFGPNWESDFLGGIVITKEKHGIIPRTIYKIFEDLVESQAECKVYCSFVQIYNERLYDLLEDYESKHPLIIREDKLGGVYVQGLTEHCVSSMDHCLSLLYHGEKNRITRQTKMNMFSSRSHSILRLLIEREDKNKVLYRAKLNLCDLAGSEKMGPESNITGKHFEELKTINLSLTTLGKVISALALKLSHIPYRDSKLTRILQDSIGGNTRTCLIATISPIADCAEESISTLSFASRAQKIRVSANPNQVNVSEDKLVKKLQQEVQYMKDILQLKRKGGMSDIHRQILLLKSENNMLRGLEEGANLRTIDEIVEENQKLKQNLGKIRDTASTLNESEIPVPVSKRGGELDSKKVVRCQICTLPVPCKHCRNVETLRGENSSRSHSIEPPLNKGNGSGFKNISKGFQKHRVLHKLKVRPDVIDTQSNLTFDNAYHVRVQGQNNDYGILYPSSMHQPISNPSTRNKRSNLISSNERLKLLKELDIKSQAKIKKEFETLEAKKKEKEVETTRSIYDKQLRLVEVGSVKPRLLMPLSKGSEKGRRLAQAGERYFAEHYYKRELGNLLLKGKYKATPKGFF